MDAYVDASGAFVALINGNAALVGAGKPLAGGADIKRRRSPGQGAYAHVTWIASPNEPSEAAIHNAVLSSAVCGMTDDNARRAAVALANYLRSLDGSPVSLPTEGAVLLAVETVTGPSLLPGNEFAYLVDALVNFEPI